MTLITIHVPPIGSVWPGQGGIYAGIGCAEDGTMAHIIVGRQLPQKASWYKAKRWAELVKFDGHKDTQLRARAVRRVTI